MADAYTKLVATADEPNSGLKVVDTDLYIGVSTRPTEHVFEFTDDADPDFKDYVRETLRNSSYDVEEDGYEIRIISRS